MACSRIRLASAGIAPDVIDAIVKPLDVGSKRLRLMLDGGSPWETFQAERDELQIAYTARGNRISQVDALK